MRIADVIQSDLCIIRFFYSIVILLCYTLATATVMVDFGLDCEPDTC